MALGFSILQIDFQNIFVLNVTFIGHNKNEKKKNNPTGVSFWKKKKANNYTKATKKTNKKSKIHKRQGGSLCCQINSKRLLDLLNTTVISREGKLYTREKTKTYVDTDVFSRSQRKQIGLYANARRQGEWAGTHTQANPAISVPASAGLAPAQWRPWDELFLESLAK